nr:unnamed protein product [Spirometra erinaceieuropaei]
MSVGFRVCHLYRWDNYHGFGLVLTTKDKQTIVSSVEERSPAELAGVRKGDIVYEINGFKIKGRSYSEVNCVMLAKSENLELVVVQNCQTNEVRSTKRS